jgi:alcohol dehydrogenase (cytochrome c)
MVFTVHPQADGKPGTLVAMDLDGKVLWQRDQRAPFVSATLATAGGLVFIADYEGFLYAFDAKSGQVLWQKRLEVAGHGFPASYAAGGRQFVAVPTGAVTVIDLYSRQFVPEITPPKGSNALVVFALPRAQ